ncbi:MAG: 50S ribosomal protein L11 methyltransferase, partial [Leptospiraceae bacterium]|nr:50S ribosomal protein L11 methyltransferase [Leptospiraceae bacterium]
KATVQTEYFLESRLIESKEYEEAYKEFYKPFDVGKTLRIIPTWEKKSEEIITQLKKDNRIPLFLNPGLAFGTGHHETTKLMIERMETAMKGVKSVLDMGTGSGVLGIAAAILGAKKICAIDIDSNAVEACKFNRNENSLDTSIDFSVYEGGFDHEKVPLEYDLTLINITFAVISKNIENIKNIQTERILFSGLITEKREAAMELFTQKLGGNLLYEASLNDWILLDWKR